MNKYKVIYSSKDRSKPLFLIEKKTGNKICFESNSRKRYHLKYKKGLLNGLEENSWNWCNPKKVCFRNWKKNRPQGIKIDFR